MSAGSWVVLALIAIVVAMAWWVAELSDQLDRERWRRRMAESAMQRMEAIHQGVNPGRDGRCLPG